MALEKNVRRKSSRLRPLSITSKIIGAIVAILLVWQIAWISLSLARGSHSQEAMATTAEQQLDNKDWSGARALARNALAISPIYAGALGVMARSEQGAGNNQAAGALFSQSAALGWRDTPTQLSLFQLSFIQGDYPSAANHLDALLRTNPKNNYVMNLADQAILEQKFADSFVERLAENPKWRVDYLPETWNDTADILRSKLHIMRALSRAPAPPTVPEIDNVTRALAKSGAISQARQAWLELHGEKFAPVYDPGFARVTMQPVTDFEWQRPHILGATADLIDGQAGLRISTDGTATGTIVAQLTALPSGDHQLSYAISAPAGVAQAFNWWVRCMPSGYVLSSTEGNPKNFVVPARNCEGQMLELHIRSASAAADKSILLKGISVR